MSQSKTNIKPQRNKKITPILTGAKEIYTSLKMYSLIGMLGWQDVRQRYKRSLIGPFWLTISMAIMIATIGIVFGQIFKSSIEEFLPFLAVGIIVWGLISSTITEGCTGFINAENIIKQLPLPLFFHTLRIVWRNTIIALHNFIIIPIILIILQKNIEPSILLAIPALLLASVNIAWITLLVGLICTRYRDIPQIVASGLQIFFYITPIIWMPSLLPQGVRFYLLDLNPFYHLIEIIRGPILGETPAMAHWIFNIAIALTGWTITLYTYGKLKHRVAYWL